MLGQWVVINKDTKTPLLGDHATEQDARMYINNALKDPDHYSAVLVADPWPGSPSKGAVYTETDVQPDKQADFALFDLDGEFHGHSVGGVALVRDRETGDLAILTPAQENGHMVMRIMPLKQASQQVSKIIMQLLQLIDRLQMEARLRET